MHFHSRSPVRKEVRSPRRCMERARNAFHASTRRHRLHVSRTKAFKLSTQHFDFVSTRMTYEFLVLISMSDIQAKLDVEVSDIRGFLESRPPATSAVSCDCRPTRILHFDGGIGNRNVLEAVMSDVRKHQVIVTRATSCAVSPSLSLLSLEPSASRLARPRTHRQPLSAPHFFHQRSHPSTLLFVHPKMYEIANKYDVVGLKELAQEKFGRGCAAF